MSDSLTLQLVLKAKDTMSSIVKSACTQSDKAFAQMNESLEKTANKFDVTGKKLAVFGTALLATAGVNAKIAGDFEQGMNNVSTIIDTNTESIKEMSGEVLKLAKNSPKAISDLTDALYSIRSAGISASEQFKVLKGSEMLAVSGLATTAEAVDVATSAINAFNLKGEQSDKIYDMFFKVVKYGKTNISEFAQGFGSVVGVVSSANIKLDEYSASVAAMTTSGLKAANAHTQLKAAIAGLSRGSKEQTAIFKKLGAKSFSDLVSKSGGMVNAFSEINKAVKGNQSALIQLVGSVEGYNAILSLTGANNKSYLQTLNDMRNGADSITEAYGKQTQGLNNQMAIMKNSLQALSVEFGTSLLPVISGCANAMKGLSESISKLPDGLKNFISISSVAVGAISVFAGTSLVFIGSVIRNLIFLRRTIRTISIASWANPALAPIAGVIALIVALGIGAVICYKKFEGFRKMCQGTWEVIKAGGAWLAVLWNSFTIGASGLWKFIGPAVKFAITIFSWIHPIGIVYHAIHGLISLINTLAQKAGGFRVIGQKAVEWAQGQQAKAKEVNENVKNQRANKKQKVDGSHALGLSYVPYDGYIAQVHKGEAILNRQEANRWRDDDSSIVSSTNNSSASFTINFKPSVTISNSSPQAKEEFLTLLNKYKYELVKMIQEISQRQSARAY